MVPMTQRFVAAIRRYAERDGIDIVSFRRGESKDDAGVLAAGEQTGPQADPKLDSTASYFSKDGYLAFRWT